MSDTLLSTTDRKLLAETKRIMEEVLETERVLSNRDLLQSIRLSKDDIKKGRTVPWEKLKRELRSKNRLLI